jgi:arabinogalactan oligomer / maltooligosaccharide transport system permease protein
VEPPALRRDGGRGTPQPRPSIFAAQMSVALALKLLLLMAVNGVALLAIPRMAHDKAWTGLILTILSVVVINYVYLSQRYIPAKYLVPGTLCLLLFQVYPVGYTAATAFTNYGTGNVLSKSQAIEKLVSQSREITDDAPRYALAVLRNPVGDIQLLLEDQAGKRYVATRSSFEPLNEKLALFENGIVRSVGQYKRLNLKEVVTLGEDKVTSFIVKTKDAEIRPESLTTAAVGIQRFRYDKSTDAIIDSVNGTIYRPKSGTFTAPDGTAITPGFRAVIGWRNFTRSFTDPGLRNAFFRVFIWNYAFAFLTIFLDSSLGLLLAVILNHRTMRGRRIYRSLLILPYAMPGLMMMLVWSQGILNTGYGAINRGLGVHVGWLDDPWLARLSILVVNMWLGFGYKFLLFTGQLQSIPTDLMEAAKVDGANGGQAFRRITLPLLLTGIAPMLIASFGFNFNNAVLILALTGGGPPIPGSSSIAGHTDILMSYTYKVAFGSGRGYDWGYATALTVLIFLMVAAISTVAFRSTKQFEELR